MVTRDPSTGVGSSGPAMKPATEPAVSHVTEPADSRDSARRRAVALAGHQGDESTARSGLSEASPSVRATALGALDRLGALTGEDLLTALADPAPSVRRRGSELAATRPEVAIAALLTDHDPSVVEMTAWSLGERAEHAAVGALSALSSVDSGHRDPLCREAAVAALGAIGDSAGLPAVLAALDDKPAVRRRAAVALAAFDGPSVEAALRRCLDDRDWQVRQVAEDLLAME
jgi:HEAT repeat protein